MKKLYALAVATLIGFMANAQLYVGGSVGFNCQSGKETSIKGEEMDPGLGHVERTTCITVAFAPTVGYRINGKWAVGIDLDAYWTNNGVSRQRNTSKDSQMQTYGERGWFLRPFVRYNLFRIKKFGMDLKFDGRIGTSKNSTVGVNIVKFYNYLNYGVSLSPVLTFDITGHFALESTLGIASIGWAGYKSDMTGGGQTVTLSEKDNSITLGLNNQTAITIGCIYRF